MWGSNRTKQWNGWVRSVDHEWILPSSAIKMMLMPLVYLPQPVSLKKSNTATWTWATSGLWRHQMPTLIQGHTNLMEPHKKLSKLGIVTSVGYQLLSHCVLHNNDHSLRACTLWGYTNPINSSLKLFTPQTRMWSREVKAWTGQPDKLTCASAPYLVSCLTCED